MDNIAFDTIDFSVEETSSSSGNVGKKIRELTDGKSSASNNTSIYSENVFDSNDRNEYTNGSLDAEEKIRINNIYNPSELVIEIIL